MGVAITRSRASISDARKVNTLDVWSETHLEDGALMRSLSSQGVLRARTGKRFGIS